MIQRDFEGMQAAMREPAHAILIAWFRWLAERSPACNFASRVSNIFQR
jgi:hypothetical protein